MKENLPKYFLKVSNPKRGTNHLLKGIGDELRMQLDEFWQKKDDPDIILYSQPVYTKSFDHVVLLYSNNLCYVEFAEYLIEKYIDIIQSLETTLKRLNKKKEVKNEKGWIFARISRRIYKTST